MKKILIAFTPTNTGCARKEIWLIDEADCMCKQWATVDSEVVAVQDSWSPINEIVNHYPDKKPANTLIPVDFFPERLEDFVYFAPELFL